MQTIEIDFEVYKALTQLRETERTTYNEVLRHVLELPPEANRPSTTPLPSRGGWSAKSVNFPEGTEFRATHGGNEHFGKVENGRLVVNGKRFSTPSAAAVSITKNAVNGWRFWAAKLPGQSEWRTIIDLRRRG